MHPQNEKE
jgi:hypothetical protein